MYRFGQMRGSGTSRSFGSGSKLLWWTVPRWTCIKRERGFREDSPWVIGKPRAIEQQDPYRCRGLSQGQNLRAAAGPSHDAPKARCAEPEPGRAGWQGLRRMAAGPGIAENFRRGGDGCV
jgi:hypothetical protein